MGAKRVTVYLVSGDLLHYFRPAEEIIEEKGLWMDILNNESMSCALASKWVIPKNQVKYVEFDES